VNVENIKPYETSMLDQEEEWVLPSIKYLTPKSQEELAKETVFQK
jgi:hypothetical protein